MNENCELLCGAAAIAAALSLPRRKIYAMIEAGVIPTIRIGGSVCIRKAKLTAWLESLEAAA